MAQNAEDRAFWVRFLPQLLGMELKLITDNAARTSERGKLMRTTDGRWQVNARVFGTDEMLSCHIGWVDRDAHQCGPDTVIVVGEAG